MDFHILDQQEADEFCILINLIYRVNMFLILEYASKGTLFDYIHNKKGLNETEAFYFFIQAVNS